jgi:hypothetical protein
MKITRLSIALEPATEQSMIMMRLNCSTITPASATEGSPAVFEFSLSNPSAVDTTYTFTNGTAGSADYTTTNLP